MRTILRWFSAYKFKIFGRTFTLGTLLDVFELAEEAYRKLQSEGKTDEAAKEDALDTIAVNLGWRTTDEKVWAERATSSGG